MKLVTDPAGISHLMASARERSEVHKTSAIYCGLQMIRLRLFDQKSPSWGPEMRAGFNALSALLLERAEACVWEGSRR